MPEHDLLGGLAAGAFLKTHWQTRWRLIRAAIPGFAGLADRRTLERLAGRDDIESRLVVREGGSWSLEHGPIPAARFRRLPPTRWTLLVQGLNHVLPQADRLLRRFDFIPYARLDDVMVSYAAPGGGVGPHFDSYDVFLLQGFGRRRWRVSRQRDLSLRPRLPLKILARFRPTHDWVLEPGDMLYLPPGVAHDGIAIDACTTYSIGFRALAEREIAAAFLEHLGDALGRSAGSDRLYRDRGRAPARHPAMLPGTMIEHATARLARIRWGRSDVARFLGRYLTEPKSHVVFSPPRPALPRAHFARCIRRTGVALDARTLMLYAADSAFVNGECHAVTAGTRRTLAVLADKRQLRPGTKLDRDAVSLLYAWYSAGFLNPSE